MVKYFNDLYKKIVDKLDNLSLKNKLIAATIFLIVMALLASLFSMMLRKPEFDYKKITGNDIMTFSNYIENDTYAVVDTIFDDMISKLSGNAYYEKKVITNNDIYKYILYSEYKEYYSKLSINKKMKNFLEKYNQISNQDGKIVREIVQFKDSFYMVKYGTENGDVVYLGIVLNPNNNKYYIWYME